MSNKFLVTTALCFGILAVTPGCEKKAAGQATDTGPHAATVEPDMDAGNFKVDHPDQFPVQAAGEFGSAPEINVTGVVSPDVSRQVPVISIAAGRIVEIEARLGDEVKKGQLLFKVRSPDISLAFSDYRKAVANEQLSKIQLDRARELFDHGAVPKSQVEVAQTGENNAKVDLETTIEHLHVLGSDPDHPTGVVPVYAPITGIITDQQITNAAGVQGLAGPNPLTISDTSRVWIICDVYENDLAQVHTREYADIRLNAYPDRTFKGRISNIGQVMDPAIRTAKVRLEVDNPGIMRLGMFVSATFHGQKKEAHASVPATAILHLHDREWIYTPAGNGVFKRMEVTSGKMLPGNMQEVISGIAPGTKVVTNALVLQNTVEQ
jgi:cobalt-zinc-cadmium efflux system membrane fusion protein